MNREKLLKAAEGYSASRGGLNVGEIRNYLISVGLSEKDVKISRGRLNNLLKSHLTSDRKSERKENKQSEEAKTDFSFDEQIQLTGVDDVDIEILAQTPLDVIDRYCRRNQEVFEVCKKERLWQKIGQQMGISEPYLNYTWRKTVERNRLRLTDTIISSASFDPQIKYDWKARAILQQMFDRFAGELSFVSFDKESLLRFMDDYFKITPEEEKELKNKGTQGLSVRWYFKDEILKIRDWNQFRWFDQKEKFLITLMRKIFRYINEIIEINYGLSDSLSSVVITDDDLLEVISQQPEISFFFPLNRN